MWWIPVSRCAIAASLAERTRAGASARRRVALRAAARRAAGGADVAGAGREHLRAARVAERRVGGLRLRDARGLHDRQLGRRLGLDGGDYLLDRRAELLGRLGRGGLLAFVDRPDAERLALLDGQVVEREPAEHVIHERGCEPDVRVVGHPAGLE